MRLIDADKLDEEISCLDVKLTGNPDQKTIWNEFKSLVRRIINEQPTAFDKEKVMNEIKEYKEDAVYWSKKSRENADEFCTYADAYQECLDIIEKGGLDE